MTHALFICCSNPVQILGPVAMSLTQEGLSMDAMTISQREELAELHLSVTGDEDAVERFRKQLQDVRGVQLATNLSTDEQGWFISSQINEVYA
ncbi:hypothetical protein [Tumebacillus flagellatus]|uniref:ACT domain-containing protein n=1 Tax=Tumebacillus flagellatus TaxID=1157490 RepID=A0A074LMX9_9BACL|nr:hypothetical protein [Tumebacillus flagellatus]KEO82479.1 hypothetical protein EL26_15485 [Tumebacillus flagellatus]